MVEEQVDFFASVHICNKEYCKDLVKRINNITPNSDIAEKRRQRNALLDQIHIAIQTRTVNTTTNIWVFDDLLENENGSVTSFTMDILMQFNKQDVRIFSPNMKQSIVDHLKALHVPMGTIVSGCGCVCRFNERWVDEIKKSGGLDIIMLDGYSSFETVPSDVLKFFIEKQAFRIDAGLEMQPPVSLTMVMSDMASRMNGEKVGDAVGAMTVGPSSMFYGTPYRLTLLEHKSYSKTMHVVNGKIEMSIESAVVQLRDLQSEKKSGKGVNEFSFFPYEKKKLRCHPMSASVINPHLLIPGIPIKSQYKVDIRCSICAGFLRGSVSNLIRQTGQCRKHNKVSTKQKKSSIFIFNFFIRNNV